MQPTLSIAPQVSATAPLSQIASSGIGKDATVATHGFGDQLTQLLAALSPPANQTPSAGLATAAQPNTATGRPANPAAAPSCLVACPAQSAAEALEAAVAATPELPLALATPEPALSAEVLATSVPATDVAGSKTQKTEAAPKRHTCVTRQAATAAPPTATPTTADATPLPAAALVALQSAVEPSAGPARPHSDTAQPLDAVGSATSPADATKPTARPAVANASASVPSSEVPAPAQPSAAADPTHVIAATQNPPVPSPATTMSPLAAPTQSPEPARSDTTAAGTTAAGTTAVATTAPSHALSPAAQVTPALVQLGHAPDGTQRLTLRLQPPELGHVEVRIERPAEAAARVEITVEKPETLTLLLRDQPQLQRALDQAGVPSEGRSVTFHLAAQEPSSRSAPGTAPTAGVAAGGLGGDGSHGAQRQSGQPATRSTVAVDEDETDVNPIPMAGWMRGGLDITA